MKTTTINLYELSELSKEAKEKALDWGREFVTDHDWYAWLIEESADELAKRGYENADINFSGFYSQGDGASFSADATKALLAALPEGLKEYADDLTAKIERASSLYSHSRTMTCTIDCPDELNTKIGVELLALESVLINDARTLADKIFNQLRDEYEYLNSDECVAEMIEANEYTFLINGERFSA